MRDLLRYLNQNLERGRELILCQVVETRGSTPQKAGALMLVDPAGAQAGTLGGGCVEAEVKQQAIRRIGQPGAEIQAFVLDHDYAWADGLICGGKMVILTEALRGPGPLGYFRAYQRLLESGGGFTEAVVVDPKRRGERAPLPVGGRALVDSAGNVAAVWPEGGDCGAIAAGVDRAGGPAAAGGARRRRLPADPAPGPARDRGGRPCGPGGRQPRRAGGFRRLGGR